MSDIDRVLDALRRFYSAPTTDVPAWNSNGYIAGASGRSEEEIASALAELYGIKLTPAEVGTVIDEYSPPRRRRC